MAQNKGLAGVANWQVAELPVGSAVLGLVGAGVGDGLAQVVAGAVPAIASIKVGNLNVGHAAMRGAMAYGILRMDGIIGKEAATIGSLFLTASAVSTLFDVRLSLANIVSGLVGRVQSQSPFAATGAGSPKNGAVSAESVSKIFAGGA